MVQHLICLSYIRAFQKTALSVQRCITGHEALVVPWLADPQRPGIARPRRRGEMTQEFVPHTARDVLAEHAEGALWETRVQSLMWVDQFVGLVRQSTFDPIVFRLTIAL